MKTCHTTDGLVTLSDDEWSALCDGCGLCCRVTTGTPSVMCPGYDTDNRKCAIYDQRIGQHACIKLEPNIILGLRDSGILPDSCGYVAFMACETKKAPESLDPVPFETLHPAEQMIYRAHADIFQSDVEGSLSKFVRPDPSP